MSYIEGYSERERELFFVLSFLSSVIHKKK